MSKKKKQKNKKREENSLLEWVKSLAIALVLFFFIRSFILHTFVIISGSMEETLLVGDLLLVNRAAVGSPIPGTSMRVPGYSQPKRDDVLVFDPHHEEDMKLVKRLIGLPGDTLEMREKALFINGESKDEPYAEYIDGSPGLTDPIMLWQRDHLLSGADRNAYQPTRDDWGPIVVPEGYYFMLGDNRDASYDSRYWGLLEQWRIEGRVSFIYFSYNRDSLRPFPFLKEIRWGRIGDRVR
jgi:signal peptidase I